MPETSSVDMVKRRDLIDYPTEFGMIPPERVSVDIVIEKEQNALHHKQREQR
jgi:hypothetical protein